MTEKQKAIAKEIKSRIRALRTALQDALVSGVQSASISQGGASQSYTRLSVSDIRKKITRLEAELATIRRAGRSRMLSPDFRICGG